jgi:hypothetical protein
VDYLFNTWVCIPKVGKVPDLKPLFNQNVGRNDQNTKIVEGVRSQYVYPLTYAQRSAEWFLFRGFHLKTTMASRILNSTSEVEEGRRTADYRNGKNTNAC